MIFYIQFSGIVFNVTTTDVKESLEELLVVKDDMLMMGKFEIDLNSTYFLVVDTSIPIETITFDEYKAQVPDWAWLVIVGGIVSTLIIGFFGVIMGVQRFRHSQIVNKKVLNPKTLQAFRGRHFDTVQVDHGTAYANDKRDMWTLQKVQQAEAKKTKTSQNRKSSYADSGRGSGMSGVSSFGKGRNVFSERFPSLGKGSTTKHNDSNAELLGAFDNTGFDESGEVLENEVTDRDTSYENEEEENEGRVSSNTGESRNGFARVSGNVSRANLLQNLEEEGMTYDASDSSLDSVSDGPSERF